MIPVEVILPLSVTIGLVTSGLVGAWYVWPRIRAMPTRDALMALIFPHCFRYLGLSFLIHGVTTAPLDHRFSFPTAYGDLLTALLGLVTILALRAKARLGHVLILARLRFGPK